MNIKSPSEEPTEDLAANSLTVAMRREGQFSHVDASCEKVLRSILRTRVHSPEQAPDGTMAMVRQKQKLYEVDTFIYSRVFRFWTGLDKAVVVGLRTAGVNVTVVVGRDLPKLQVPAPNKKLPDMALLEHVATHDRGLVRYDSAMVNTIGLVSQVAHAWPDLKIAVITSGRRDSINIAAQLRDRGIDAFGYTAQHQVCVEARVSVCTFMGMAFALVEPEKQDIMIVLDAAQAIGKEPRWCLGHAIMARMYGLLRLDRSLSPYEEDMVRCLFGFEEVVVPRHGYRMRPVEVGWAHHVERRPHRDPGLELDRDYRLKRSAIWNNDLRNRLVARVARAFIDDNHNVLTRSLMRWPVREHTGPPRAVFIIVENVEHALRLLPKLPGWSILGSGVADLTGLSDVQRDAILQPRSVVDPLQPRGIITHAGMRRQEMPWARADVVIRADAGTGLPGLPAAALMEPDASPRTLVVVDFDDTQHPLLEQRTTRRWRAYENMGWYHPDMDAVGFRVAQFLRRRSGRGRNRGQK